MPCQASRKRSGLDFVRRSVIAILPMMNMLFRDAAGPCLAPHGSVVCIGAFDGVHLGHRAVLERVRERASILGLQPIAVSFEPIPRTFFARGAGIAQLTSAREKVAAMIATGMQRVLLLRFDAALAAMSAEEFVAQVFRPRAARRCRRSAAARAVAGIPCRRGGAI